MNIKVRPNSPKFRIYIKDELCVDLVSPPDKNKANTELLRSLKSFFGSEVRLISGHKSRKKIILVKTKKQRVETLIRQLEQN